MRTQSFRTNCRGPKCRKLIELHIIDWEWRPRLRQWDPKYHPFDVATDLGTGQPVATRRSHYLTCPDAEFFGGPGRAVAFPEHPVLEPKPTPEPQKRLF